ncbi:hypothetical protein [Methylomagnum sp.]
MTRNESSPSILLVAAPILLIQLAFLARVFPLSQLVSDKPLLTIDHAYHLYQLDIASGLLEQGRLMGYEPRFNAGYLGGLPYNASGKLPALLAYLFKPVLTQVQIYKIYVFFASLIAPICAPLAALILGFWRRVIGLASLFGLLLWWVSAFHWYHTAGMVSFVLASFATLPYCALLSRLVMDEYGWKIPLALGLSGGLLFLLHPLFPLAVAVYGLALLVSRWGQYSPSRLFPKLSVIALLSLLPNLFWIMPTLDLPGITNAGDPYQKAVDARIFGLELLGLWRAPGMGAKLNPLLVITALWAAWQVRSIPRTMEIVRIFLFMWIFLALFAAFGAAIPALGAVQPNRFGCMAYLFLVIPAAVGINEAISGLQTRQSGRYPNWAILFFAAGVLGFVGLELSRELSVTSTGRYGMAPPEVRGFGDTGLGLADWLNTHTNKQGRVLFETSLGRIHDGAHLAGLLAKTGDREFIGGPYPYLFFAGFWDGHAFGKPIEAIPRTQFAAYLKLYNIGWIAAHSPASKRYLAGQPGLELGLQSGAVQTYVVEQPLSYFLEGEGSVTASATNRLVIRSPHGAGQPLVLKYHYMPGMISKDGSVIAPVFLEDDPQPFIRIIPNSYETELAMQ